MQRINYDEIAHRYDEGRYRPKQVDSDLVAYLAQSEKSKNEIRVLDISCGTGNQLVANEAILPATQLVGLDLFRSMLSQAGKKSQQITWLQGDGANLPFINESFDFITNQYAFHHIQHKAYMLKEVFRVLRPNGRFVMSNVAPSLMPKMDLYRYFPITQELDKRDFLSNEALHHLLVQTGFSQIHLEQTYWQVHKSLQTFLKDVEHRTISQLVAISDTDYQAGLTKIKADYANGITEIYTEACLIKITSEKRRIS